jgi:hypothetical protein
MVDSHLETDSMEWITSANGRTGEIRLGWHSMDESSSCSLGLSVNI